MNDVTLTLQWVLYIVLLTLFCIGYHVIPYMFAYWIGYRAGRKYGRLEGMHESKVQIRGVRDISPDRSVTFKDR